MRNDYEKQNKKEKSKTLLSKCDFHVYVCFYMLKWGFNWRQKFYEFSESRTDEPINELYSKVFYILKMKKVKS